MPIELLLGFDEFGHPEVSSIIHESWDGTGENRENEPRNLTRAEQDKIDDELDALFGAKGHRSEKNTTSQV